MRARSIASRSLLVVGLTALAATTALSSAQAADDNTAPVRVLDVSAYTGYVDGLAVSPSGQIYLAQDANTDIDIFAAGASGTDAPVASIANSSFGGPTYPYDLVFDAAGNLYVAASTTIFVYAPGATGTDAPVRTITGAATGLSNVLAIAIGPDGNLYAADAGTNSVKVFAAGADGDVAPLRTIAGANTTFGASYALYGIAVDASGTIFVSNFSDASIRAFAPGADGDVAPIRTIAGANTGLNDNYYLKIGNNGNIWVSNYSPTSITIYANSANGDVAPLRTIVGPDTTLSGAYPIALTDSELYVGNYDNETVSVFAASAAISSVSPNSGAIAGGTTITITGSGFAAGASVTVGGVAATNVTVVSPTTITATVPAHAKGAANVTVSIPGFNDATAAAAFTFTAAQLAATGLDVAPIGIAGLALLALGAAVSIARRRIATV